ncbi:hypothetical protein CMUS01_03160 [Colletotrichum musicola]|uniref:Uncharacterized protein n=1 Tax=Colletotrichum musicola TaxID=2175873 RepID=A0A8H6U6S6_9PEZI|nr:hypothetical protein CMUS01_03160 [Colletotrichum musicola]
MIGFVKKGTVLTVGVNNVLAANALLFDPYTPRPSWAEPNIVPDDLNILSFVTLEDRRSMLVHASEDLIAEMVC